MRKILAITALGTLLFQSAWCAEPQPWMKSENPHELGYWSRTQCPELSEFNINSIIEDVMARWEIKPITSLLSLSSPFLHVVFMCVEMQPSTLFAYSYEIRFGDFVAGNTILYEGAWYGATGKGGPTYIETSVENSLEDAITDYLKANFQQ